MKIDVIGAGLAGSEAAWYLAQHGQKVCLYEQKPVKKSPAHHSDTFAELVCSNSLKADRLNSAGGLLKAEMRMFDSICLKAADTCRVAAGGALAVDRDLFSEYVTKALREHPNITVVEGEVTQIPTDGMTVIATGPLTEGAMAEEIQKICGSSLSFFDAAAPIVTAESIDPETSFAQSRYGRGGDDYINCPMNKEEYEAFAQALREAESAPLHGFDKQPNVYEGCMPIEIMARRGSDTIRFGPLKPVGLRDPRTGHRPWAAVQLRAENSSNTMYNLVGFQTNLKFGEQKRVFSMIPALKNAEFVRYGVMHRNSFINSPTLLESDFSLCSNPNIFFAGQMTGVEGYMESAMSGILAAVGVLRRLRGQDILKLPVETMMGALSHYISDRTVHNFQPMGASFGLLPQLSEHIRDKKERYMKLAVRSTEVLEDIIKKENLQ